jgi:hypothetical protein
MFSNRVVYQTHQTQKETRSMEVNKLINIQKASRLLAVSTRALHERVRAGYYKKDRVGTILVDPETNMPLTVDSLEAIPVRGRGRPPGKYGPYKKRKKRRLNRNGRKISN